jgi:malate dehydrogenase
MITAIVNDTNKVLPCCVLLEGEYGINNIFVGVPVILGKDGIRKIIELDLNDEEMSLLNKTADTVRELSRLVDSFNESRDKA